MVNFYSTVKSGPTQEQLEVLTKLYDSGKNELILSKLETLLKSFPNDPALLTLKGLVYDALLNHSKALACYDQIIKSNSRSDYTFYYKANSLASLGDSDAALKQYDKAISINPNFYQAHYNAGCIFMSKNDLHAAIESFKKVITLDPHSYKAYYNVGLAQLKSRQFKEALENVRKVITLNRNFADGYILMGNILRELMHIESAIIHYQKALGVNPFCNQAHNELSYALRYYIWATNTGVMANIASIDKLIESEKRKLLTAIKDYPFWFVDVPKTSSTAIKYLLGQKYGWPFGLSKYLDSNGEPIQKIGRSLLFPDHTPAFLAKSFIGEEVWNSIDTFAVVRHPYRWCLSMWHHSMTLSASNLGLRVDTFDHFLNSIEKKFDGPHTERKVFVNSYRQVDYLLDSTDKMIVKFIFKLEDRASIDEFLKKKGILEYGKTHLMRFGNETKSKDYQLTKGQMKRINSIFEKDFELLGY